MIPEREYKFLHFRKDAEWYDADTLIVMLGTNDLLEGTTAGAAAVRVTIWGNTPTCYHSI